MLVALLLLNGCASAAGTNSLWTQCVKADGWGLAWLSELGIVYVGKLTWERNVACDKDIKASVPILPARLN